MGPFVVHKVAGLYGQRAIIEDPDGPSGKGMWVHPRIVHASHLGPFAEPYIEPQEITLNGFEELGKPA